MDITDTTATIAIIPAIPAIPNISARATWHLDLYLGRIGAPSPSAADLESLKALLRIREAADRAEREFELPKDTFRGIRSEYRAAVARAVVQFVGIEGAILALIGTGGGRQCPGAGTSRGGSWTRQAEELCRMAGIPVPAGLIRSQATGGPAWTAAIADAVREEFWAIRDAVEAASRLPEIRDREFFGPDSEMIKVLEAPLDRPHKEWDTALILERCPRLMEAADLGQAGACLALLQNRAEARIRAGEDLGNLPAAIKKVAALKKFLEEVPEEEPAVPVPRW